MAQQVHSPATIGYGEGYFTGDGVAKTFSAITPTGGVSFTAADTAAGNEALKHVDIVGVGGSWYFTTNGVTPDATLGFPVGGDSIMPIRNSRKYIQNLKVLVPVGVTLHWSWGA